MQDYGFRLYNPAIGKFLSVDPLSPEYPELTPYQFASNTPIWAIDLDGLEAATYQWGANNSTTQLTTTDNNSGTHIEKNTALLFSITRVGNNPNNPYTYNYRDQNGAQYTTRDRGGFANSWLDLGPGNFFDSELGNRLLTHYGRGEGAAYRLSEGEMEMVNAVGASITNSAVDERTVARLGTAVARQTKDNQDNLSSVLAGLKVGESGRYTSTVQALARASGTLGQFSIWYEGSITKTSETDWEFSGTMTFMDTWDFDSHANNNQSIRGAKAENDVSLANKWLSGSSFSTRGTVNVTQKSSDNMVDWFRANNRWQPRSDIGRSDFGGDVSTK